MTLEPGSILHRVGFSIPLGTAVFEEVAFRGVLFGLLMRRRGTATAIWLSSALFGLYHIGLTVRFVTADTVEVGQSEAILVVIGAAFFTLQG